MQPCPPPEQLKRFLGDQLGAAEATALTQHVETCASCWRSLDDLSADADGNKWRRLRNPEPPGGDEPQVAFLRRMECILAPGSSLSRAALQTDRPDPVPEARGEHFPALPGYDVLEKRGRGAIGVVYKARDPRL